MTGVNRIPTNEEMGVIPYRPVGDFMEENLAQEYFEKVMEQKQPGGYMLKLFCDILEIDPPQKERISYLIMFNKFVKLYGREIAFLSLLEMLSMELDLTRGIYSLYSYLCNRRFIDKRNKSGMLFSRDLHEFIKEMEAIKNTEWQRLHQELLESPLNDK